MSDLCARCEQILPQPETDWCPFCQASVDVIDGASSNESQYDIDQDS